MIYLKNIFLKLSILIILIYPSQDIFSQSAEYNETTGGNMEEEYDFLVEGTAGERVISDYATSLDSQVTISFRNANLVSILKSISRSTGVVFIYDDELLNIEGVNIEVTEKNLYKTLRDLLSPFGISFYEYSAGKIAIAKEGRISEKTGKVQGFVKDENDEPLIGAVVMIKELQIGTVTNMEGFYCIPNIKPGNYVLDVSFIGYEPHNRKISVRAGQIIKLNFSLKAMAFQIGGIEVVGTKDLLPRDVNTKTEINSGEIEHYQASSIKDVLDLVPGVQKTDNPGLGKSSQIAVRGDENDRLSAFGTLVVVDGSSISNNANLQFESLAGAEFGNSTMGTGIDLRTIPADNIESIEVITGLPSVKYGEATEGVINVKTKIGASPLRLKLKNNPDTKEANFGGGYLINKNSINFNLNAAYSERDPRISGDEYTRLSGDVTYSSNLFDNAFNTNNKISFQRILDDEQPVTSQNMQQINNYNHGYTIAFSSNGAYKPAGDVSSFVYNFHVNMTRQNSMRSKLISEIIILPNGDTVSSYIGKVETKGIEWNTGGRLEWNNAFYTGSFIHKTSFGIEPQYDANTGEGLIIDSVYNYYGSTSGMRSYNFDSIPGQFLLGLYAEDKMTGHFLYDFGLTYGLRYDMYRPYKFNFSGLWGDGDLVKSHQGSYVNPRLNLMIFLSGSNQLRISAGTTSKSPAMSDIYPYNKIFTWRNPVTEKNEYFSYNRRVPDLKGYREVQYELAFDQKVSDLIGFSASLYYKNRTGEPINTQQVPVFAQVTSDGQTKVYYVDSYSIAKNIGKTNTKGIELTFKTTKIKPLNIDFQFVCAYNYIKNNKDGFSFDPTPDNSLGQYSNFKAPNDTLIGYAYAMGETAIERLQLNYYIKYTHPSLGLWVTLRAEQVAWEKHRTPKEPVDLNVASPEQILSYLFDISTKTYPNKWLLNINVSKSLFAGAEVSFYVNNFLDDPAIWHRQASVTAYQDITRNPDLSYGIEFSMILDDFFRGKK